MDPAAPSAIPPLSAPVLARSDLPDLANFRDTNGHAVSFFFSLQSIPDKSHHTEVILVRDLVREELHQIDTRKAPGLAEDMEAVLMQAEEVRENPRYWRISYACHRQGYWRKFELPAPKPIRQLHVGGRFLLAPMFWALNFCTPYGVLIFERGRARIFVVRGFQIQEFNGRLPKENITLHTSGLPAVIRKNIGSTIWKGMCARTARSWPRRCACSSRTRSCMRWSSGAAKICGAKRNRSWPTSRRAY